MVGSSFGLHLDNRIQIGSKIVVNIALMLAQARVDNDFLDRLIRRNNNNIGLTPSK